MKTSYIYEGKIHERILDNKNALVYYPNRMDWYKFSNPRDPLAGASMQGWLKAWRTCAI